MLFTISARRFGVMILWIVALDGGGVLWRQTGALAQVGCVWEAKGGVIDLRPISKSDGSPRFKDVKGDRGSDIWYYSYNPCNSFNQGKCSNVAVCQRDHTSSKYFNCGETKTASIGMDSGKTAVVYTSNVKGTIPRKSTVALICDPKATSPVLNALGDLSNGDYHFELTSTCACPGGCSGASEKSGLSIGTILIIVVLALVVMYVAVGLVFNVTRQKSGTELIPNVEFWKSFPGYIKDGFGFTFSICRGPSRSGYQKH